MTATDISALARAVHALVVAVAVGALHDDEVGPLGRARGYREPRCSTNQSRAAPLAAPKALT